MNTRFHVLDFYRGLAAIGVVFIHTAFKSGASYVPAWMQSVSLLLDVPFFFFLSGWSRSYSPTLKRTARSLVSLYGKYCFFISVVFLLLSITGFSHFRFSDYLMALATLGEEPAVFPVIMGSIWFLPVLFTVVPLCMLVIRGIRHAVSPGARAFARALVLLSGLALYLWCIVGPEPFFFQQILFYGLFFLIGYGSAGRSMTGNQLLVMIPALVFGAFALAAVLDIDMTCLQDLKFPPHLIYMLLSLLSVAFAVYFKDRFSPSGNHWLVVIGKNAIWFYFAQGISSSLLYALAERISCFWALKLLLCTVVNILMTACIAFLFAALYRGFCRICVAVIGKIHPGRA